MVALVEIGEDVLPEVLDVGHDVPVLVLLHPLTDEIHYPREQWVLAIVNIAYDVVYGLALNLLVVELLRMTRSVRFGNDFFTFL